MLKVYDILFTIAHLVIIGFNLTGWIWKPTRRAHLYVAGTTIFCWIVLGIWYGIGYCPLTDWHWAIKEELGETNLPASFIKYFIDDVTGLDISPELANWLTAGGFAAAIIASLYINFFKKSQETS